MHFRFFRFSLRKLIAISTCVMIITGMWAIRDRRVQRQKAIYEELVSICGKEGSYVIQASLEGEVQSWYDYAVGYYPQYEIVYAGIHDRLILIEAAELLGQCEKLRVLDLTRSKCNDDILALVAHACPNIKSLDLAGTAVTDECVVHLAQFVSLEEVDLERTSLTGKGFAHIGTNCRSLQTLGLEWSALTAEGLQEIAEHCLSLENIDVSHTKINAIDLIALSKIERLKSLRAIGVQVPEYIDDELSFLLPNTELDYERISNPKSK